MDLVDVLIPTYERPVPLALTLTSVLGQTYRALRIVISDQAETAPAAEDPALVPVMRVLQARGYELEIHRHLPRRGMAEQRQFLLDQSTARYALFLDDDVILEPNVVERLVRVLDREGCGFAGNAVLGLSFVDDIRPDEQAIEFWDGPVQPETIEPDTPAWARWRLHNAANLWHVQRRLGLSDTDARPYRVAWVGGCVMYDTHALRAVGGFSFWRDLPPQHAGEDVMAQLRVMRRFGGCGVLPSGAFHQELDTTIPDREVDAPRLLPLDVPGERR